MAPTEAMDPDDFNSSDVEFEEAPKPFANAGRASVQAMIENATADRIASKQFVKQLSDVRGSRQTQYLRTLWATRFEAYYGDTLKIE